MRRPLPTAQTAGARDRLCSVFSNANYEDPGGTAPSWKRCVIIELDEPWGSEVAQSRHFPAMVSEVLDRVARRGLEASLQCIVPDPEYSVEGQSRVIFFARPEGPFTVYDREEFVVPKDDVWRLLQALLEQPERVREFETYRHDTSGVRDILVCTHGAHDTCCATFGYPVYEELRNRYVRESGGSLRVWRVSHLGGHRFSPNIVDLPEGRNWVRMGLDSLEAILYRNRPVSELRPFYRGWLGLDSLYAQLVERELFMQEGWGWTQRRVSGQLLKSADGQSAEVRVEVTSGANGGASEVYEATVERTGSVPRVSCPASGVTGEAAQFTVSRLVKVR